MVSFKNKSAVFLVLTAGIFATAVLNAHAAVSVVSAKVTGPNAVTIVYSEPVTTAAGDYTNFNGSLSGLNVLSVTGSGTNTVTLNLSGTSMLGSASGYVTIGANVNGVSDNTNLGGGTYQVTDGQSPTLSAISITSDDASGTFSGVGSTITVTFSTNEPVTNPSITIAGHSVSLAGGGQGPWSASYMMQAGDSPNAIPISLTVSDMASNQLQATFSASVGATAVNVAPVAAASAPVLTVFAPIPAQTSSQTPTFTFTSSKAGTIAYNGGCSSATSAALAGANTITFNTLPNGTYANCTILVTDPTTNLSSALSVPAFTVGATGSVTPTSTSTPSTEASSSMNAELELRVLESQLAKLQLQQTPASSAAATPLKYKFTGFLNIGSTGAAVTALQKLLTTLGFYSGPVTGKYEAKTAAAVRKYQSAHGVAAKGYVGPGTRALLNAGK